MKKSLLTLTVATLCLAGCGKDNNELKKKTVDGKEVIATIGDVNIFADDQANKTVYGASGAELIYKEVAKLVTKKAYPASKDIKASAEVQLDQWKEEMQAAADSNGTTYAKEEASGLESAGVASVKELQESFEYKLQQKKLQEKFWSADKESLYAAYVNEALPYHISHYLLSTGEVDSLYFLDTIDSTVAERLGYVIEDLADSTQSFASIASDATYGSDCSSAAEGGDLGIMDLYTSFVSEFKFSVYLADYFIRSSQTGFDLTQTPATYQAIVNSLLGTDYYSTGAQFIPFSVVSTLTDKDVYNPSSNYYTYSSAGGVDSTTVSGSRFYERNTIYNNYFNKPGFSFIEYDGATADGKEEGKDYITVAGKKVLAKNGNAIIVTRSSGLEANSGVHFIMINESPLDSDAAKYFAPAAVADDDFTSYVEYYGSSSTKDKVSDLETLVKKALEFGSEDSDNNFNIKLFEKYYNEYKDEISIPDACKTILEDYIADAKELSTYLATATVNETIRGYESRLNAFTYYFSEDHYVPADSLTGITYKWNATTGKFEVKE